MARPTPQRGHIGGSPSIMSVSANVPAGQNAVSPFIGIPIESNNATVYTLINSVFDPRVIFSWAGGDSYDQNYSLLNDYRIPERKLIDLLFYRIFDERPGRQEPPPGEIHELIDNIADVSRMLGIYYTAYALKESRDPGMYERARLYELDSTMSEMQLMLSELPLPRIVAQLNAKYVGLMDVSSDSFWQNVGFLVNGNYQAFNQLYDNVRNRRFGLRWGRMLYQDLGMLGAPTAKSYDPDFMTVFANANYKLVPSGQIYAPYVVAAGASEEPFMLQSAGILHSAEYMEDFVGTDGTGHPLRTLTGWAFPGTGHDLAPNPSAIRTPYPYLCKWVDGLDRAIDTDADDGSVFDGDFTLEITTQPATVQDATLAANIAHEYNMAGAENETARVFHDVNLETGFWVQSRPLAPHNVRARMTAGFSAGQISWQLDANMMSFLAAVVSQ